MTLYYINNAKPQPRQPNELLDVKCIAISVSLNYIIFSTGYCSSGPIDC